ncbi:MAG TPA: Na+/H+ antiporter NhaA [Kofleriaceae bacterium]|nr:Na+/H+ antiporter NhaA [Kofleriaceae bacterium]
MSPIQRFLQVEAASGLVLIAATVIALVWANSPWSSSYHHLWHTELSVSLDSWSFARPLHFWVNDGLMTIFFFVVGLEIRREMHEGELSDLRRAALPLVAAVGGMLAPAAIYAAFNVGRAGSAGWGVPMATDIAFAVGVLTLLGRRVAPALRVLLLALAVIDDIGAILVIAVFYSAGIDADGLLVVAAGLTGIALLKAIGVRIPTVYVLPGLVLWAGMYQTGIHPTLAGVVLGLMTPVRAWSRAVDDFEPESPAAHLQHVLHRWVAFVIMPLFALANAGVQFGGASLAGDGWLVFVGIVLGLGAGKPIGIFLACRASIFARVAVRPRDVSVAGLGVVGLVAGIGFTMSLFIAQLAFPPGPLLETAKLAILIGSFLAALVGLTVGAVVLRPTTTKPASEHEAERSTEL